MFPQFDDFANNSRTNCLLGANTVLPAPFKLPVEVDGFGKHQEVCGRIRAHVAALVLKVELSGTQCFRRVSTAVRLYLKRLEAKHLQPFTD